MRHDHSYSKLVSEIKLREWDTMCNPEKYRRFLKRRVRRAERRMGKAECS